MSRLIPGCKVYFSPRHPYKVRLVNIEEVVSVDEGRIGFKYRPDGVVHYSDNEETYLNEEHWVVDKIVYPITKYFELVWD